MTRPYVLERCVFDPGPPLSDRDARIQRHVADLLCEFDDRLMWHMLIDDLTHLRHIDLVHREFHGGKFQTIPKPSLTLFGEAA